mmetsp:Transcript_1036/g.1933  ORF Transcript_1036/g.1933 Transcript_1036/m.1933 type:complete len:215 (-) Transcript_1036:2732-3376(-)
MKCSLSAYPLSRARLSRYSVGSAPADSTKMRGVMFTELSKQPNRSNGGETVKNSPSSAATKFRQQSVSRFSRTDFLTSNSSNAVSFFCHAFGKAALCKLSSPRIFCHSPPLPMSSKSPWNVMSEPSRQVYLSKVSNLFQANGEMKLGAGGSPPSRSSMAPLPASTPRRKNSHSGMGIGFFPQYFACTSTLKTCTVTRKAKSNLWSSNRPLQMFK